MPNKLVCISSREDVRESIPHKGIIPKEISVKLSTYRGSSPVNPVTTRVRAGREAAVPVCKLRVLVLAFSRPKTKSDLKCLEEIGKYN